MSYRNNNKQYICNCISIISRIVKTGTIFITNFTLNELEQYLSEFDELEYFSVCPNTFQALK